MDFDDVNDFEGGEGGGALPADDFYFGFDEQEVQEFKELKDSVLFLIDCRKSMLAPNSYHENTRSNVSTVLQAIVSFMKTKIITSDNDKIGIVLYGCKDSLNSLNFDNIFVMQTLEAPDAQAIKNINSLIDNDKFAEEHGSSTKETLLHEALWICHTEFKSIEKQSFNRRIFLFTNEDDPCAHNKDAQTRAIQRAHDLSELNVTIELFPMSKPPVGKGGKHEEGFDIRKFYADLVSMDEDEISTFASIDTTNSRITELMKRIRQKEFRKRTLGKCLFSISPKMQIGIRFFNMVHEAKKPTGLFVHAQTNKVLKSTTRWICQETGAILFDNQISTHFPFGGEKVDMTKEDIKHIKAFDTVGLKLMGFKPKEKLKMYHNVRTSIFLYPDEQRVTNSSQVVNSLIKAMLEKDKIAIVRFIPREQSVVKFCALLPQEESISQEDNFQTPPGFQLVFLPYADDIRTPESIWPQETEIAERNLINAAKTMVKNLTIDFDCRNFENPSLQTFYSSLQALALNEKNAEEVEDLIKPDEEGLNLFKEVITKFKDLAFGDNYAENTGEKMKTKGKRTAPVKAKQDKEDFESRSKKPAIKKAPRKKTKVVYDDDDDEDDEDGDAEMADFIVPDDEEVKTSRSKAKNKSSAVAVAAEKKIKSKKKIDVDDSESNEDNKRDSDEEQREAFRRGKTQKLTIPELKVILANRGLPNKGKKQVLIDTLEEYFGFK